ncbi:Extracellular solute-binding protein family 3 [uncultured Pleomorphomonas sp.]|uniref:Extracellular solute-binding protein family 3 n=1 Tax=uncultured Pleomorphomonas sp. TaxID=442121 RepID=A0A212LI70_9HYPH|nr:transporter substrate-binding domain-containing protein [uncultured Pleomorphomonas sp.]SCM77241.1 Extracellular solute-binding protein family 3 [uncultured Pleomorphomonas sp.]
MRLSKILIATILAACVLGPGSSPGARAAQADYPQIVPLATGPATAANPPSIRFVTSDDFPPFNFVDGSGLITGFNVEVARAICTHLSIPCTVQVRPFPLLLGTIRDNKADAIAAGVADTPALRRHLAYSVPYFREPARFVRRWPALVEPSPRTLAGKAVGVISGSRYADFIRDYFPAATPRTAATEADLFALLKDGEVDAVFTGAVGAAFWLAGPAAHGCCAFSGGAYTEPAYFGDGMKIAVAADNMALKGSIDGALRALDADGTLADLALRFFPESLY